MKIKLCSRFAPYFILIFLKTEASKALSTSCPGLNGKVVYIEMPLASLDAVQH